MRSRALAKTITWRLLAISITVLLAYLITGSMQIATTLGLAEIAFKMVAYYLHEVAWERSSG